MAVIINSVVLRSHRFESNFFLQNFVHTGKLASEMTQIQAQIVLKSKYFNIFLKI